MIKLYNNDTYITYIITIRAERNLRSARSFKVIDKEIAATARRSRNDKKRSLREWQTEMDKRSNLNIISPTAQPSGR